MGHSVNQQVADIPPSQQPPQTGINPNPAPVAYSQPSSGKGGSMSPAPQPVQPAGKGMSQSSSSGKGGSTITTPVTSGQPQMGVPNSYANTIQSGDNSITPQPMAQMKGKGS